MDPYRPPLPKPHKRTLSRGSSVRITAHTLYQHRKSHIVPPTCVQLRHADVLYLDWPESFFQRAGGRKRCIFLGNENTIGVRTIITISEAQSGISTHQGPRAMRIYTCKFKTRTNMPYVSSCTISVLESTLFMKGPTDWHPTSGVRHNHPRGTSDSQSGR